MIIFQAPSEYNPSENSKSRQQCYLDGRSFVNVPFAGLGDAPYGMPMGSVEFCQEYMRTHNIKIPAGLGFPSCLEEYFHRTIGKSCKQKIEEMGNRPIFVKPVALKIFTGFVLNKNPDPNEAEFHAEQLEVWKSLPPEFECYYSEVVNFKAEWRCYVSKGCILGLVRYDDHPEEYSAPSLEEVREMISAYTTSPVAYCVDIGLLDTGKYAIVELNDAYALGYYGYTDATVPISVKTYIEFLATRWAQVVATSR